MPCERYDTCGRGGVGSEASKSVVKRRLLLDWGDEPSSAQAPRTIQNTGVIDISQAETTVRVSGYGNEDVLCGGGRVRGRGMI